MNFNLKGKLKFTDYEECSLYQNFISKLFANAKFCRHFKHNTLKTRPPIQFWKVAHIQHPIKKEKPNFLTFTINGFS